VNKLKPLSIDKQVLFMFGTLCAILVAVGALSFFSLRAIEPSSRENLSYVVNEAESAESAAQNIGLMQAGDLSPHSRVRSKQKHAS
jgi:CHASE3 domain sensor protein